MFIFSEYDHYAYALEVSTIQIHEQLVNQTCDRPCHNQYLSNFLSANSLFAILNSRRNKAKLSPKNRCELDALFVYQEDLALGF